MTRIKRFTATLFAQFNSFVDQIENHEAIAESALKQFRAGIAKARYQAKCLMIEVQGLDRKLKALNEEREKWTARARRFKDADHSKAIACMRRLKAVENEIAQMQEQRDRTQESFEAVKKDLEKIEHKYRELQCRYKVLSARDARVSTLNYLGEHISDDDNILDLFDRWQAKVEKNEIRIDMDQPCLDPLKKELEDEDFDLELEEALKELTNEEA